MSQETRCYVCDRPMPVNMAAKVGEPQVCWECQLANLTDAQTTAPTPTTHPHSPPTPSPQQSNSSKGLVEPLQVAEPAPPHLTPKGWCSGCAVSGYAAHPLCRTAQPCGMCRHCPLYSVMPSGLGA